MFKISRIITSQNPVLWAGLWFVLLSLLVIEPTLQWTNDSSGFTQGIQGWLGTYEGGFVRRALPGELILFVARTTGMPQLLVVWLVQQLISIAGFVLLFIVIRRTRINIITALLLISPATLMFAVNDTRGGFGRTEMLIPVLLLSYLLALQNNSRIASRWLVIFGIAAIASVFVHEMMAFFAPLFLLIYLLRIDRTKHSFDVATALTIPVSMTVAFLGVVVWGVPDSYYSTELCGVLDSLELGYICDLGDSWPTGISSTISWVKDDASLYRYFSGYPLAVILALAPFALLLVNPARAQVIRKNVAIFAVLTISAISMIPLFLLGLDWGRWIHTYMMGLLVVWLASPLARQSISFDPKWHRPATIIAVVLSSSSFIWRLSTWGETGIGFHGFVWRFFHNEWLFIWNRI